jgi:hypothetical protein
MGKDGMRECKYYDGCSAPLCPRDEGAADGTWFVDEEICRLADVPGWVRRQRKIARKTAKGSSPGGYFTLAMLKQDCQIRKGMKGIDPDGTEEEQVADEAAWLKVHPVMTAETREKKRAIGHKNKGFINGTGGEKDPLLTGPDEVSGKKGSWIPPRPDHA